MKNRWKTFCTLEKKGVSSHLLQMMTAVPDVATYFLKVLQVSCHKFKLASYPSPEMPRANLWKAEISPLQMLPVQKEMSHP